MGLEGVLRDAPWGVGEGGGQRSWRGRHALGCPPGGGSLGGSKGLVQALGDPGSCPGGLFLGASSSSDSEPLLAAGGRASLACWGPLGSLHSQRPEIWFQDRY